MVLIFFFIFNIFFISKSEAEIFIDSVQQTNQPCQKMVQTFLYKLKDSFPEQTIFLNPINQHNLENKKDLYFSLQCHSDNSLKIKDQINRIYNLNYSFSFNGFNPLDWYHFTESFNINLPKNEGTWASSETLPISASHKENNSILRSKTFWAVTAIGIITTSFLIFLKNSSSKGVQVEIQ